MNEVGGRLQVYRGQEARDEDNRLVYREREDGDEDNYYYSRKTDKKENHSRKLVGRKEDDYPRKLDKVEAKMISIQVKILCDHLFPHPPLFYFNFVPVPFPFFLMLFKSISPPSPFLI